MDSLIARLQVELALKKRLTDTGRRDCVACLLLNRIDREITEIKRILHEKGRTQAAGLPSHTDRALHSTKEGGRQHWINSDRDYNPVLALSKAETLYQQGASQ